MATAAADSKQTEKEPEKGPLTEEPVLDLSALAPERPRIRFRTEEEPDGKLYELAVMNDFGIEEQQQLTREGAEFDNLWNADNLTLTDKQRLKQLLDRMFDRVLIAPDEIKDMLNDGQKSQCVMAFTLAPLAAAAARQRAKVEAEEAEQEQLEKEKAEKEASTTES